MMFIIKEKSCFNLKKYTIKEPAALVLFLFIFISLNGIVFANPKTENRSKTALTISPVKTEIDVNPGTKIVKEITLTYNGTGKATISTEAQDFVADASGEKPSFVSEDKKSPYSMSSWIKIKPGNFILEPGKKKTAIVTIKVPRFAEPGGHYAAAIFSAVPPAGSQTSVYAKIGSLFLLRVTGNEVEVGRANLMLPRFVQGGPVNFKTFFENQGNVHVKPKGSIIITPVRGKNTVSLPIGGENVLPDSRRAYIGKWTDTPRFGLFRVQSRFKYGSKNKTAVSGTHLLLILPLNLLASVFGLLALGIVMGYLPSKISRIRAKRVLKKEEDVQVNEKKEQEIPKEEKVQITQIKDNKRQGVQTKVKKKKELVKLKEKEKKEIKIKQQKKQKQVTKENKESTKDKKKKSTQIKGKKEQDAKTKGIKKKEMQVKGKKKQDTKTKEK